MTFTQTILAYSISVFIFIALDVVWLGTIASGVYRAYIGYLLGPVNWPVAIVFYLLFLVGLHLFAIVPAIQEKSFVQALLYGALFGFFCYCTYDLTNWATIRHWPAIITIIDITWGTALSGTVASLTYWITTTYIIK